MNSATILSVPHPNEETEMEIRLYWKARRTKYQTRNLEISSLHSTKTNILSSGEKGRTLWLT